MTTLAELLTEDSADTIKARLLVDLDDAGFPVTDWYEGGVARTLVEIEAQENADFYTRQATIARGGYLTLATGAWLTLLCSEFYQITRYPATRTEGVERFTCAATAGPYVILPGQLWVTDAAGHRYTNITGGTLATSSTLDLTVQAESAGTAYNVAAGTITTMVTVLAGVTCTNITGGSSWPTVPGTDEELDVDLRSRATGKWATLGYGQNDDWYEYYCKNGHAYASGVTRVKVQTDAGGTDQITLTLADSDGGVAAGVVTTVDAWIVAKLGNTITRVVQTAGETTVAVTADAYVYAQYSAAYTAAATTALQTLYASIPIGGTLYLCTISETLMTPDGVRNVTISAPSGDTSPAATNVVKLGAITLTVHSI